MTKSAKRTLQAKVDELIDWYDKYKPELNSPIHVSALAKELDKFCLRGAKGDLWYRSRIIVPTDQASTRKQRRRPPQVRVDEQA